MNDKDKKNKEITGSYKDKDGNKYEIKIKEGEEKKFKPEGKSSPEITVKDVKPGFFKTTAKINGEEKSIKWGLGLHLSYAIPAVLLVFVGAYFLFFRKKKNKHEEEAL